MARAYTWFPPQGVPVPTLASLGASLDAVLVVGNVTGGNDLDVSTGDTIAGVAELALVSDNGDLTLTATGGLASMTAGVGDNDALVVGGAGSSSKGGEAHLTGGAGDGNAGGDSVVRAGAGGSTSNGGVAYLRGGQSGGTSGNGGQVFVIGGGTTNGAGGAVSVSGADGGASGTQGGSALFQGGAGTGAGTGGSAILRSGAADTGISSPVSVVSGNVTGGTGNSGAVHLDAGTSVGGTAGAVNVGPSTASAVNVSRAGVTTTVKGALTVDETSSFTGVATFTAPPTSPGGTTSEEWGAGAVASGNTSTAVGASSQATADNTTAVGKSSTSTGSGATSLGTAAAGTSTNVVAIGNTAAASGASSIMIGMGGTATQLYSVAIGQGADSVNTASIALGGEAATTANNQAVFGSTAAPILDFQTGTTANGAYLSFKNASESFTSISTATLVTTNLVPAGATLLYVVGLVDTTISGGGVTDADWGDGSTVNRYNEGGTAAKLTAADTIKSTDYTALAESWSASTQDVTITFQGGTPTAGALTVTAFYTLPTAGS